MRILVLNWRDLDHPDAGGAERYVHEVSRRWVEAGHEVTLFCGSFPGASTSGERDGVRILRKGTRWSVFHYAADYLRRTRLAWDAVVESVNTRPFFAHRIAPGIPTVAIIYQLAREVWFHEMPLPVAALGRFALEPLWLRHYRNASVATISDSTRRDLEELGFRQVAVVPPGRPDAPRVRVHKDSRPSLLFMGRLKRSKGPLDALETWRIARRFHPQVQLWVVGDGPLRASLEREGQAGLKVFGRVDEATKWQLAGRAHLLLVPSVREGWGLVVMEAAVAETPSIGYRVPGLVDAIRHGDTGWLCDPNPAAMASSVRLALENPGLSMFGQRARSWVESFSWEEAAADILSRLSPCERTTMDRTWIPISSR